jgi:ABC-type bacteriocin/lantibiotic exporter with double-glycine peptidase domain
MIGAVDRITDIFVLELSAIVFNTIFITIVVGIQNIYFSIIFISWISIFTIVQYYFYKWNYPYEIRANEQDSKVSGVLADTITNNFNIKTFSTLKREFGFFDEVVTKRKSLNYIRWMRAMVIWTAT